MEKTCVVGVCVIVKWVHAKVRTKNIPKHMLQVSCPVDH